MLHEEFKRFVVIVNKKKFNLTGKSSIEVYEDKGMKKRITLKFNKRIELITLIKRVNFKFMALVQMMIDELVFSIVLYCMHQLYLSISLVACLLNIEEYLVHA